MRLFPLALLPTAALLIAACSSGVGWTATPSPAASPSAMSDASASPEATRVAVRLTDAVKMEPAMMAVRAGVPVTFVVTNAGSIDHEFYLGDEAAQAGHEKEMQEMGGMRHDEEMGIGVKPGETKELTVTFPTAGSIVAACHEPGQYAGGMKATIEVGS